MTRLWMTIRTPIGTGLAIAIGLLLVLLPDFLPGSACDIPRVSTSRLSARLDSMEVFVQKGKEKTRLEREGLAFHHSSLPSWNWVGIMRARLSLPKVREYWDWYEWDRPWKAEETCLWIHPVDNGSVILRFNDVPASDSIVGFTYFLRSARERSDARLKAAWNGIPVGSIQLPRKPGDSREFAIHLPGDGPGTLDITVTHKTSGKDHLCFDGWLIEAAP
jgi:hypothetical protein